MFEDDEEFDDYHSIAFVRSDASLRGKSWTVIEI